MTWRQSGGTAFLLTKDMPTDKTTSDICTEKAEVLRKAMWSLSGCFELLLTKGGRKLCLT
jgi:hypothetical protein